MTHSNGHNWRAYHSPLLGGGVGGEALSPFTLPRKVNGVTTPFDADCTIT